MKRILIAEDSPEWQKYHILTLKEYQKVEHSESVAADARSALELVEKEEPYDLILSDLQMETDFLPELAGEWFVKKVKAMPEYKNVPIVLVSATYNIGFLANNLGVDYLSKRSIVNYPGAYFSMLDKYLH